MGCALWVVRARGFGSIQTVMNSQYGHSTKRRTHQCSAGTSTAELVSLLLAPRLHPVKHHRQFLYKRVMLLNYQGGGPQHGQLQTIPTRCIWGHRIRPRWRLQHRQRSIPQRWTRLPCRSENYASVVVVRVYARWHVSIPLEWLPRPVRLQVHAHALKAVTSKSTQ